MVQLLHYEDGALVEGLRLELDSDPRCIAFSDEHVSFGDNMGGLAWVPVSALK